LLWKTRKEYEEMGIEIEIRKSLYEKLEEICELRDETVASLVDEILSEWMDENYEAITEEEIEEEEE
jgi:predicted DNA-binding ribbon-helix-helix protein